MSNTAAKGKSGKGKGPKAQAELTDEMAHRKALNISTDFTPYEVPEGQEPALSSFDKKSPAAWVRNGKRYSQAEYERCNGRRSKLEQRLHKRLNPPQEEAAAAG